MIPYQSQVKQESRARIQKYYRSITGLTNIPNDCSYITLCAPGLDEYQQFAADHFITDNQFIGINRDPEIIKQLEKQFPNICFYSGEMVDVLREFRNQHTLKPAIVNCDLTEMSDNAISTIIQIMGVLKSVPNVVLPINVMLNNPRRCNQEISREDWIKTIDARKFSGWQIFHKGFEYQNNHTKMCTTILYKGAIQ